MAAPCWLSATRPLWRLSALKAAVRSFASGVHSVKVARPASPWLLHGAVCLQRPTLVSQEPSPVEERMMELMTQMELEKSMLSDHELRLLEDADRLSRKQDGTYDSDEEDEYGGQTIVTAQDLEDTWEQKLKQFIPAARTKACDGADVSRPDRCLGDGVMLLLRQDVGGEMRWLLPQLPWQPGETLRQTAERALATLTGAELKAKFLGNAPCGFYKYKFPKNIQTESRIGAKVFFFKALLDGGGHAAVQRDCVAWVRKDELQDYLAPEYLKQVKGFIMDL